MLTGCREYRTQLIEMARGPVDAGQRQTLLAHMEVCRECARALEDQLALSSGFERLKTDPLPEMAAIEARVLAEFDRTAARRPSRWLWVAGLAAAICLGVVLLARHQPASHPVNRPSGQVAAVEPRPTPPQALIPEKPVRPASPFRRVQHTLASRRAQGEDQPFVQIPYTVPLAPEERTTVVRMEIPVAALIAAGFSVPVSDPGASIDADVVISQDGRARAIRPVAATALK